MSSAKHKLRLTGAFAALAMLALGVSCTGFFKNPTLQSISLQPATPALAVNTTQQMQAWGTDSDGVRSQLSSGVSWEVTNIVASNGGAVMTITPGGLLSATSVGSGTIQASAQGISGSTTATVVELTSTMTIEPLTSTIQGNGSNFQAFEIKDSGGNNISALVTLTAEQNNTAVQGLPCGYQLVAQDLMQDCQPSSTLVPAGTQAVYSIVVTYSGYTGTATVSAQLTVTGP